MTLSRDKMKTKKKMIKLKEYFKLILSQKTIKKVKNSQPLQELLAWLTQLCWNVEKMKNKKTMLKMEGKL